MPMHHPTRRLALPALVPLGLAALLAGGGALAQSAASGATPPAQHAQATASHRCGGIGVDESTAMRAAMKDYPLSLLFARADGAYEANVDVRVSPQGGSGQAMQFTASGPVCLLQLPAGSYQVDVQGAGQRHSRTVKVGGAPQSLDFRF